MPINDTSFCDASTALVESLDTLNDGLSKFNPGEWLDHVFGPAQAEFSATAALHRIANAFEDISKNLGRIADMMEKQP